MSKLVITLGIAFGFLLLALAAEVWYLLCWKKRRTHAAIEIDQRGTTNDVKGIVNNEPDLELGSNNNEVDDVALKTLEEEGVEEELKRLHNLAGPPRFLFTIKEETKEDLESEDGKSKCENIGSRKGSRTRSLSDLMVAIDTPFLNPVASSTLKSSLDSYMEQGFNPVFESSLELELNNFRSSPPPKFKFLRDAEEKLFRRLVEEAQRKAQMSIVSVPESEVQVQQDVITEFSSSSS